MNQVTTDLRGARAGSLRGPWMLGMPAFLLGTMACALFGFFGDSHGPRFPHAKHLDEVDCTTCHEGAEEHAVAGFPTSEKGCMLCHAEIDKKKPFEKTVAAFLVDGKPVWLTRKTSYGGDVRFDHSKHIEAELECDACHAPVKTGSGPGLRIHGGKPHCKECHAKTKRGNDCAVCHKVLRKDQMPPSHKVDWQRRHGLQSDRMIENTGQTTCAQCHQEQTCTSCHQQQPPRSHTNYWRQRGHAVMVSIDRSRCATCHRSDFCNRCHQDTRPRSHRGMFGSPQNTHCLSCHLPLQGEGCFTCHKGTPSHQTAAPMPANHLPSMNCRQCHGLTAPLPHPDNGSLCTACHK
jgi:hypothetical protein